jgi:hypothetical protein
MPPSAEVTRSVTTLDKVADPLGAGMGLLATHPERLVADCGIKHED